jgi:hypothetical protein
MDGHKTCKTGQSGHQKMGSVLSKNGQKNDPDERKKPLFWWGGQNFGQYPHFLDPLFRNGTCPETSFFIKN